MAVDQITSAQTFLPSGADGVSVTPNGSTGVFGSWVEVTASLAANSLLTGIVCTDPNSYELTYQMEVEIGVGAAGAEAAVAVFYQNLGGGASGHGWLLCNPPLAIASGSRVAARMKAWGYNWPGAASIKLAIGLLPNPPTGTLEYKVTTGALSHVSINPTTGASASTWGNWSQLVASCSSGQRMLCALSGEPSPWSTSGTFLEVQLGVGAAGAETVVAHAVFSDKEDGMFCPVIPPVTWAASSRLAMRTRSNSTSTAFWCHAVLSAVP